jgi:hypothetical protein
MCPIRVNVAWLLMGPRPGRREDQGAIGDAGHRLVCAGTGRLRPSRGALRFIADDDAVIRLQDTGLVEMNAPAPPRLS